MEYVSDRPLALQVYTTPAEFKAHMLNRTEQWRLDSARSFISREERLFQKDFKATLSKFELRHFRHISIPESSYFRPTATMNNRFGIRIRGRNSQSSLSGSLTAGSLPDRDMQRSASLTSRRRSTTSGDLSDRCWFCDGVTQIINSHHDEKSSENQIGVGGVENEVTLKVKGNVYRDTAQCGVGKVSYELSNTITEQSLQREQRTKHHKLNQQQREASGDLPVVSTESGKSLSDQQHCKKIGAPDVNVNSETQCDDGRKPIIAITVNSVTVYKNGASDLEVSKDQSDPNTGLSANRADMSLHDLSDSYQEHEDLVRNHCQNCPKFKFSRSNARTKSAVFDSCFQRKSLNFRPSTSDPRLQGKVSTFLKQQIEFNKRFPANTVSGQLDLKKLESTKSGPFSADQSQVEECAHERRKDYIVAEVLEKLGLSEDRYVISNTSVAL